MSPLFETAAEPTAREGVSRRDFFVRTAGGLALGFLITELGRVEEMEAAGTGTQVTAWLNVNTDNTIVMTIGSSEMGQGSSSGLAQILAEELMVDYTRITVVQGGPVLTGAQVGNAINTVGSSVIRTNFWKVRNAGAIAREMLLAEAMTLTQDADRTHFAIANGVVTWTAGPAGANTFPYGKLAETVSRQQPVANPPLVQDANFRLIGRTVPRLDIPSKVNGGAKYGIDIRLPNMLYAVVKHSPAFGGTLASTPAKPSNIVAVVPLSVYAGTGRGLEAVGNVNAVAVVGGNTWDAWQAAKSLSVKWNAPANAALLNNTQFVNDGTALLSNATPYVAGSTNPPGTLYTVEGDASLATSGITGAQTVVELTFQLPYVAHATMEVLNCTVDYVPGVRCDIYVPTQSARAVLQLAQQMTGLAESQIVVHTTYLGGGLGRKAEQDFVSQAIQVGMAVRRPVKLMWPREEDFAHDQYRPMAVVKAKAGINSAGNIVGWAYRNVSPSILGQRGAVLGATGDSQGSEASSKLPYNFNNHFVTEWVSHPSPIPVGFWRSVGASINTFAVESMIDQLAIVAGQNPYTYRRNLLTDPRWIAVLDEVAQKSGFLSVPPTGRFRGIAIGTAFGSIVAEVVEISNVTSTSLRVNSVTIAMDCYVAVNPGQIEAQLTGGVVHGLNAALYGRQVFVNGVAQNRNFKNNRMIRIGEMPTVKVSLIPNPAALDSTKAIGGAGELGVPTFAPALANAYYQATKKRLTSLPMFPAATMGGL